MRSVVFVLLLAACQEKPIPADSFVSNPSTLSFEGRVPLGNGQFLYQELLLLPDANIGEGHYSLTESVESENDNQILSQLTGQYSSVYGAGADSTSILITLHHSGLDEGVKRIYKADPTVRIVTEEMFRRKDVVFVSQSDHHLVLLDNRLKPIATDPEYNLYRRRSRPFTVEGYFTHAGYSAELLEINTNEKWPVAKMGDYQVALQQYYQLRKEKFERLYVKAVAFSTIMTDDAGKPREVLVLKKMVEMQSSATASD